MKKRSYADLADSATTFNPEAQFDRDIDQIISQPKSVMDEILKALEACRQYVRFNHKATAWHNDREAYEIMTNVIEPAIKKAIALNQR